MSVFTVVTPEQLGAWLRNYPVGTLTGLQGIPAGIENTNYFVTTTQGRYVLTLFEKLQAHELPFYLGLMAHLSAHAIPCPKPVANLDNEFLGELNGKPASLVSFLSGKDITDATPAHCAQVGALLANLHVAGQSYALTMDNPRGPKWWKAVMPEIIPFMPVEDVALLREEVRFQSLYRFSDLPRGVIHADLFRDNVSVREHACVRGDRFLFRLHRRAALRRRHYGQRLVHGCRRRCSTRSAAPRCSTPTAERAPSPQWNAAPGR